jgi:hypothetical protein
MTSRLVLQKCYPDEHMEKELETRRIDAKKPS